MEFAISALDHPARAPYGIFKQAASNLWGNMFIGLGSRLNVFQNKKIEDLVVLSASKPIAEKYGPAEVDYFARKVDN